MTGLSLFLFFASALAFSIISGLLTAHLLAMETETGTSKSRQILLGFTAVVTLLVLSLLVFYKGIDSDSLLSGILYLSFFSMLVVVAIVDGVTQYIFDRVLYSFTGLHILLLFLLGADLLNHLIGSVIGFAIYGVIHIISLWIYKQESFGKGDVLLMAAIGWVLGYPGVILAAMGAFYVALAYIIVLFILGGRKKLKDMIPFGPFICISAIIVSFYGTAILAWYF